MLRKVGLSSSSTKALRNQVLVFLCSRLQRQKRIMRGLQGVSPSY